MEETFFPILAQMGFDAHPEPNPEDTRRAQVRSTHRAACARAPTGAPRSGREHTLYSRRSPRGALFRQSIYPLLPSLCANVQTRGPSGGRSQGGDPLQAPAVSCPFPACRTGTRDSTRTFGRVPSCELRTAGRLLWALSLSPYRHRAAPSSLPHGVCSRVIHSVRFPRISPSLVSVVGAAAAAAAAAVGAATHFCRAASRIRVASRRIISGSVWGRGRGLGLRWGVSLRRARSRWGRGWWMRCGTRWGWGRRHFLPAALLPRPRNGGR